MMNGGEPEHTSGFPGTIRPAFFSSPTDLQVEQTAHNNLLHQGDASSKTVYNARDVESFSHQGQYFGPPVGGAQASLLPPLMNEHMWSTCTDCVFHHGQLEDVLLGLLETSSATAEDIFSSGSSSNQFTSLAPQYHHNPTLGARKAPKHPRRKQEYIRKPLNAFMLFMKDKRSTVRPSIKRRGNGAVNAHLGSVWKSLSSTEQDKYHKEAEQQRFLHQQQHPDWSTKDNYAKMLTKAEKRKLQEMNEQEQSWESEESPPSKWMMLTPKYRDSWSPPSGTQLHWDMKLRPRKHPNY